MQDCPAQLSSQSRASVELFFGSYSYLHLLAMKYNASILSNVAYHIILKPLQWQQEYWYNYFVTLIASF
jgi:hypothetical protein